MGASSLPSVITALVRSRLGLEEFDQAQGDAWTHQEVADGAQREALPLLLQTGRVAANLAIDNGGFSARSQLTEDDNRRALIAHGYPATILCVLAAELSLRSNADALSTAKALTASLLNLSYLEDGGFSERLRC